MGRINEYGPLEGRYLAGLPVDPKALAEELTQNLPKPAPKDSSRAEGR